jgi:hypothetical protein
MIGILRWGCWKKLHVLQISHVVLVVMNGLSVVCNSEYDRQAALMIGHANNDAMGIKIYSDVIVQSPLH